MFVEDGNFADSWVASKPMRDEWAENWKKTYKDLGGESLSEVMNKMIVEELRKSIDKPQGITQERFEELTQVKNLNGEVIGTRQFLNQDTAYELLFESIDQLSKSQRFFMIWIENALGMTSISKTFGMIGKYSVKKAKRKTCQKNRKNNNISANSL